MKVFALISGGKDSIFNIVKCIEQGHQIVALGNLYNENQGTEMDSYMYQTVGTNTTLAIAQALNKPLFRHKITGTAKIKDLAYVGDKQGDEVQDLFGLVKQVKQKFPEINAISSGAIFSTYQKNRVEDICKRLDMTSLAYLWHRDQTQLIKQMIDYPINAIIIKVASYGMKKQYLGKTIQQLLPIFEQLKKQCGMNVCGQGGQFQSLVLDCPLFTKRIIIDQSEIIIVDQDQVTPVAYLIINKLHLENK